MSLIYFFLEPKSKQPAAEERQRHRKKNHKKNVTKIDFFFNLTNTMHSASQQISERAVVASDELIVVNKCTTKYRRPEYPTKYWHDKDVTGRDMTGK